MITNLVQNDTNPLHIAQLTGHKNLKSLDSYSVASNHQQKQMSHTISGTVTSVAQLKNVTNQTQPITATCRQSSYIPNMQISGNNNKITITIPTLPPSKRRRPVIFSDSSDSE
jgi:ankyrin repeat protein